MESVTAASMRRHCEEPRRSCDMIWRFAKVLRRDCKVFHQHTSSLQPADLSALPIIMKIGSDMTVFVIIGLRSFCEDERLHRRHDASHLLV